MKGGINMKYKLIVIMMVVLSLFLLACGSDEAEVVVPVDSAPADTAPQETTPTPTPITPPASTALSAAESDLSKEKLKKGERVAISTPFKMMSKGGVYVFAVGIKNIYPKEYNFKLNPNLDDAKSTGLANLIHTDQTIIDTWLGQNRFTTFSLGSQEEKIIPLIVEVGSEVAAGDETVPGSYTFEVVVEYEVNSRFWDRYNVGADYLTIKVK